MSYIIVIPARYQSSRLPGKPLVELCGIPMIIRTYRQCLKAAPKEQIYVATDNETIKSTCESAGINVIMTSSDCLTGTDRVAEVSRKIKADTYINVQGDEPVFNPEDLKALISAAQQHPDDVINGYCTLSDETLFRSSSTPKVVIRPDGRLLYMSRAPIPTNKAHGFDQAWRQVCAYAFPRQALEMFAETSAKTPLESIEDIEILRFLELGLEVRMIPMTAVSVAVDNPEDIERAELVIRQLELV